MSNYLFASYQVCEGMSNLSPRGFDVVDFSVCVVYADGCYTITTRRSDTSGFYERKAERYEGVVRAILGALRVCCGYRSSYWSCAKYSEVSRNLIAQLRPYLPGAPTD